MSHTSIGTSPSWFGVYVQVRHERTIERLLNNNGVECFVPLYTSRREWKRRKKVLELPLFPGYVFCRCAWERRNTVLATPGVIRIVSYGARPAPLDEGEILSLQKAVGAGLACEPATYPARGARVRIESGPLSGSNGVLILQGDNLRILLSISLLQRSVAIEVNAAYRYHFPPPELVEAKADRLARLRSA